MSWLFLGLTGVFAGIASGIFGIGGGLIIVPALVLLFGYSQHTAVGTSLIALLLPVGALAVYRYWAAGKLTTEHFHYGFIVACGIFIGALLGAKIALGLSEDVLRKSFAVFLVLVAGKMWFKV